jgi:hypothetical protein
LYEHSTIPNIHLRNDSFWRLTNEEPFDIKSFKEDYEGSIKKNKSYTDESYGPYGSKVNQRSYTPEEFNRLLKSKAVDESQYNKKLIKKYPPASYQFVETYKEEPYGTYYAIENNEYTRPDTKVIEDKIDRKALKEIYPDLTDKDINNFIKETNENPRFITNSRYNDGSNRSIYNWDKNYTDVDRPETFVKNKLVGYLPEEIQHNIATNKYYLPVYNKPEDEYFLRKGNIDYLEPGKPELQNMDVQDTPINLNFKKPLDYKKRQWDFNSSMGKTMRYYDGANKLLYSDIIGGDGKVQRFYESDYEREKTPMNIPYAEWEKMFQKKEGGWLDEYDEDFKKGGNLYTPAKLKRKVKKYGTSKNIQSSINKLFTKNNILHHRNYDVFGPSGTNVYNPNSRYELGGNWLDELPVEQKGGSIVDYLKSKGIDSSKENRAKLAKAYGIKNYDYTAEKNTELLDRLQNAKPVATKPAAPKPIPSYLQPIRPIEKPNARSTDRTGQKKNVKIESKADLEEAKWYTSLPKEAKQIVDLNRKVQYKEPDELKQHVPQGVMSKAWDVITNPMTALEEYHKHGYIPDNLSESPDRNAIDMAVDVVNPAFYLNAAGRTAQNLATGQTYTDIAKGLGAGALTMMGEQAPDEWVEGGLNTVDKLLDAATTAQALKLTKTIPRGYRDMKYNNEITIGKGANKQTFRNSADFLEAHKAKMQAAGKDIPLKKKEVDFLNKEIKQRGILEANRRHPLDPRSAAAKALVVPEDYNWKTVLNPKNIAKNLYKTITEGSPESRYTMGHGRIAGWNNYLGIPTKNNPYRVHPESFTQGENLLYTLPEKQIEKVREINKKMGEQSSGLLSSQISPKKGIKELEFFKNMPAKNTRAFNEKAYDRIASDMRKLKTTDGKNYYSRSDIKELLGPKSKFSYSLKKHRELAGDDFVPDFMSRENNVFRTGDWDRYIGSHGGVGWKVVPDEATGKERWIMEDVWDIQPLSRIQSKAVPQFVKDIDFGNILGGRNYKTRLDYFKNPNSNRITPLVPKKTGGWLDNLD